MWSARTPLTVTFRFLRLLSEASFCFAERPLLLPSQQYGLNLSCWCPQPCDAYCLVYSAPLLAVPPPPQQLFLLPGQINIYHDPIRKLRMHHLE